MLYYPISALINFLASVLAFCVVIRKYKIPLNRSFAAFSMAIAFWSLFYFLWQISATAEGALWYCNLLTAASIFIPVTFFRVCVCLVYSNKKFQKTIKVLWAIGLMLLCSMLTGEMVVGVETRMFFEYWPVPGFFYSLYLINFTLVVCWGCYILYSNYRRFTGIRRNQVKYVMLGSAVGFIGGITNYPLWYNIPIAPVGNILVSAYVLLLGIAIARYKLMDIRLVMTKAGVFLVGCVPLLVIPFVVGHKTQEWLLSTSIAIVFASLGPMVYRFVEGKAEEKLLSEQRRYQSTLMQAARGMVKIRDINRLMNLITHICSRAVKTKDAHFFMIGRESDKYILCCSRYSCDLDNTELHFKHPVLKLLSKKKRPVLIEELSMTDIPFLNSQEKFMIIEFAHKYRAAILIPSVTEGNVSAFLTLGLKAQGRMYTADDINVFNTLAHQAALAIENCQFMEDFKKAQEKVFNAEKLATLGAMASGLSHQLNNRLQAFSAISADLIDAADFMVKKNDLPKAVLDELSYMQNGLRGIEENVVHSAQIIRGVLDYARTEKDTAFKHLDIVDVITPSLGLLKVKHNVKDLEIDLDLNTKDHKVFGSVALLSEAIFNLIDNAYEAILQREEIFRMENRENPPKNLKIATYQDGENIVLNVADNGIGIKKDDNVKMYAPFFTTKTSTKSGTGLGMYVIKRIIEDDHKGKLWYESEYLKGTTFYLELPTKAR